MKPGSQMGDIQDFCPLDDIVEPFNDNPNVLKFYPKPENNDV